MKIKLKGKKWKRPESDKDEPFIIPMRGTGTSLEDQLLANEKSIINLSIALNELFQRVEGLEKKVK